MGLIMRPAEAPTLTRFAVETSDLTFAYDGHPALAGLSLSIATGALCGLLGPNGSGKSTLLSILAGLRNPDGGVALTLGEHPSPVLRARVGLLFQETCLDPLMTANETLALRPSRNVVVRYAPRSAELGAPVWKTAPGASCALSEGEKAPEQPALLPSQVTVAGRATTGLDPTLAGSEPPGRDQPRRRHDRTVTNKVGEADQRCDTVAFIHRGRGRTARGGTQERQRDAVWAERFADRDRQVRVGPVGRLTWAPPVCMPRLIRLQFCPRLSRRRDSITAIRLRSHLKMHTSTSSARP
jgi:ABC-type Fe3+/spermidine/putrescine transport system ATPase subunit